MRRISKRAALAVTLATAVTGATALAVHGPAAYAASTATIDGGSVLQQIDGFGFSSAFARAQTIEGLSAANQKQVLDLLFSPTTGAGLNILRLGVSSTGSSIEPNNSGGPTAPPQYVWNGDDDGQVWLAKQAQSYGVSRFYANPWSAPGYMKDNGSEANGGTLCGLSGTSCASGDWRAAYANYLIQYTKFYQRAELHRHLLLDAVHPGAGGRVRQDPRTARERRRAEDDLLRRGRLEQPARLHPGDHGRPPREPVRHHAHRPLLRQQPDLAAAGRQQARLDVGVGA
jgi:hypothetical protein